jgi:hypothetical protein
MEENEEIMHKILFMLGTEMLSASADVNLQGDEVMTAGKDAQQTRRVAYRKKINNEHAYENPLMYTLDIVLHI